MKRLFLFAIFFALFALFALLACGEGPSAEQSPPTATSTRRVTSRPTATETAPPTDTPDSRPPFHRQSRAGQCKNRTRDRVFDHRDGGTGRSL